MVWFSLFVWGKRRERSLGMKRSGVLLLASIMVMVVVGAGVALAANIDCGTFGPPGGNCLGTNQSDNITGTANADHITAASGNDNVNAAGGNDDVYGDRGEDTLNGSSGEDEMYGDSGPDTLNGGDDADYLEGGTGANVVNGQGGNSDVVNVVDGDDNDFASGGAGINDQCIIDGGGFVGSAAIFSGPDANSDDFSASCEDVYRARE
jgi:Ca2+-binding RTX toxin-like protein